MTDPSPPKKFISFGFRCSSAALLKQMGLKTESYPFDWLISDLSVIRHCIETRFAEFENPANYERKYTNTYEMAESREGFVCDEHLMVNRFYQPPHRMEEENTYCYQLAMNHHNITETKDAEYYHRCIERFHEWMENPEFSKIYVHIRRLVTLDTYENEKDAVLQEFLDFDAFLHKRMTGSFRGLFFILVKDKKGSLIKDKKGSLMKDKKGSREQPPPQLLHASPQIWLLYVNPDFVDAGETFMGNYDQEVLFIKNVINTI